MLNSPLYVIYSSCGSFWLPLIVIVALNVVIFTTARTAGNVKGNSSASHRSQSRKTTVVYRKNGNIFYFSVRPTT